MLLLCCCAGPCQRNTGLVRWIFSCGLAIFVRADAFNLVKALGKIRQRAKTNLLCNLGQAEIRAAQQLRSEEQGHLPLVVAVLPAIQMKEGDNANPDLFTCYPLPDKV